jgi:hypothetical protein
MTSWIISRLTFYSLLYIVHVVYVLSALSARHLGNQLHVRTRSLGTENIDIGRLCDSAERQRALALVRVVAQVRALAVTTILTLAGVGACFSEASQELVEQGVHSRHTSDNGEEVRFGGAPIEAGCVVVCKKGFSDEEGCEGRVGTYMLDSASGQT